MDSLEIRKAKVELMRVQAAKAELELKIFEREMEIERIRESIKVQEDKIVELEEKIK